MAQHQIWMISVLDGEWSLSRNRIPRCPGLLAVDDDQPVVERGAQSVHSAVALCELPLCGRWVLCAFRGQIHVGEIVSSWHRVIRVDPETGSECATGKARLRPSSTRPPGRRPQFDAPAWARRPVTRS